MTAGDPTETHRQLLEAALPAGRLAPADLASLARVPEDVLATALRTFADEHGAAALPVLEALTADRVDRALRRAARRALYRLAQRGIASAPKPPPKPVVERKAERPSRAWISGIDGAGSRAAWILFEGGFGGALLCSLIVNDTVGILEAAGGEITKKRLDTELRTLRASQKLPWVEVDATRVVGLVAEALALHESRGTAPPADFSRWRPYFAAALPATAPAVPSTVDPSTVDQSGELLDLPELAGWFLDPEALRSDAVDLLEARESRLIVSDQIKAERETAIVETVVARELDAAARQLWARRLSEMALIFRATDRAEPATRAEAAAAAFLDDSRDPRRHPFAVGLARRGLAMAGEVALGRVSMAEVSRKPEGSGAIPAA